MAATVTYQVQVDSALDGTWATDITGRISRLGGGFSIRRGINDEGVYQISGLDVAIENLDGEWSPRNTAAALAGLLTPGLPIRIRAVHSAVTYTLWTGYMQDWSNEHSPGGVGVLRASCRDIMDYLNRYGAVNVVSSTARDSDGAIEAILTAVGISASLYSLDDGVAAFPFHFVASGNAVPAIMDCVYSELGGVLWVSKAGVIRFEARSSRLGVTADRTWGDGTNIMPRTVRLDARSGDLLSKVEVQATIFQADQLQQEVFSFQRGSHNNPADSLFLAAGIPYEADFHYTSAVLVLADPVASEDYLANASQDGSGADRTSSLTPTVTDKGGRATVRLVPALDLYVTAFRLLATVETFLNDRPIFVAAKSIAGQPSDQTASIQIPWADDSQATRDYAVSMLRIHRYPLERLHLSFDLERHNDIAAALLDAELGELVQYTDTGLGDSSAYINDLWYIESISYRIGAGEVTGADITLLPAYAYRDLDKIVYDLFTRANAVGDLGTALSGDAWADDTTFDIASNAARPNTATGALTPNLALGAANCVVEISLSNMSADTDESVGMVYRYADANNYWAAFVSDFTNLVYLRKVVAGVTTDVTVAWTPTDTAELRVIVQGNRHRVWVDRKLVHDTTDAALNTNTRVGLYSNATTVVTFDDFYASGL